MNFRLISLTLLLALAVGGPWAWFHVGAPDRRDGVWLKTQDSLTNFTYLPDPLNREIMGLLATTNAVNGAFIDRQTADRFTVFRADWLPTEGVGKTVVNHTPDVCWVGAGWRPIEAGQPEQIPMRLQGLELPFECRVFEAPTGGVREVTVWCTLVNGEILPEPTRFGLAKGQSGTFARAINLSELAVGRFVERIRRRQPANGHKQFVRFSVRLNGDVERAVARLQRFGSAWIAAEPLAAGHLAK